MYLLQCAPNGSCFQIASRLGIEVREICRRFAASEDKPQTTILDGIHPDVLSSAENLRSLIAEWQQRGLETIVPHIGFYDEASKRPFTRGDLLALEAIRHGMDVPEKGPKRLEAILTMISKMKCKGSWASTPEYIAVSNLCKCSVEIQVPKGDSLELRDSCRQPDSPLTIKFRFTDNHYDLLVDDSDFETIQKWFGDDHKIQKIALTESDSDKNFE